MPSPDDTLKAAPTDAELIALVDTHLRGAISSVGDRTLCEAVEYAIFGGGKRIRPLLCLRSCIAVGGQAEDAAAAACAVELIHTFSLVHDDLPAMDDDDLRRGRPTLHKHTSEAMAILAGDAMVTLAFEVLAWERHGQNAEIALQQVGLLSGASTTMIKGQVHDTMGGWPEGMSPRDQLHHTHRQKTGALIYAAVQLGALSGLASEEQRNALSIYAGDIGVMFQAVDDLLDVTQSTEQVGKQTGKDAAAGKLTYPGLLGVEGTRAEIAKLLAQSLAALEPLGPAADPLRDMARKLAERTK